MPNNDSVSRETTETPGGPGRPPARPPGPACSKCGREPASPGQSYGPNCHAAYMRMWRQPRQPTPAEDSRLAAIAALLRAAVVVLAVLGGLVLMDGAPANVAPAHPWRYPCVMHLAGNGRWEWFTPARLFWDGRCQQ